MYCVSIMFNILRTYYCNDIHNSQRPVVFNCIVKGEILFHPDAEDSFRTLASCYISYLDMLEAWLYEHQLHLMVHWLVRLTWIDLCRCSFLPVYTGIYSAYCTYTVRLASTLVYDHIPAKLIPAASLMMRVSSKHTKIVTLLLYGCRC